MDSNNEHGGGYMRKILIGLVFLLTGCVLKPAPEGFEERQIQTEHFSLAVWVKDTIQQGQPFRLYIEGDGDPNPKYQIAKYFASIDDTPNVIYTARPCQWSKDKICKTRPNIYGIDRFHPDLIQEMQELTEYLIKKYHAPSIELIGYDSGAVIALELAAKLPVSRVITIAGITDTSAYALYNGIRLPDDAVNPSEHLSVLSTIPQIHYVGADDDITPRRLVERFVSKMYNSKSAMVKVVSDTDHTDWEGTRLDY